MQSATTPFITIVSGLPRSGTSMMMRALDAGGLPALTDGIRAADHDNPGGYYELEVVKQLSRDDAADTAWLERAQGRAVKIIYRLLYHLPDDRHYKVIYMKRRLEEVVASQQAMITRQRTAGSELDPATLIRAFAAETRKAERWLLEQANVEVLPLDYAAVLLDPEDSAAEIAAFLGVELDISAMAGVIDPSLYRQRA